MFDSAPFLDDPPLQQSAGFERTLRAAGQAPKRLPDGTLMLRRKFYGIQVSMLARFQSDALPDRLRGPLLISPDRPNPRLRALPLLSPQTIAELDLSEDLDHIRRRMHGKWRNRLRHAFKQNLRVTRQNMPVDPDHWLLQANLKQQKSRKFKTWSPALTCTYAGENKGDAKLFTALSGREAIAGLLVLRHGNAATYHIGHSTAEGRVTSAQTLLMWSAMVWLQSKHVRRFELGTIDTESAPGLARFKLGTGAVARKLGGTWLWHPTLLPFRTVARLDQSMMR